MRTMAPLLGNIGFFKKRKLKAQEMTEVCNGLQYAHHPKNSMVIKYGEEGDMFYIILKGKVSVWTPVPIEEMRHPLNLLRDRLKRKIGKNDPQEIDFRITKRTLRQEPPQTFGKSQQDQEIIIKINRDEPEDTNESSDSIEIDEEAIEQENKEWCTYHDFDKLCSEKLSEDEKKIYWRNLIKERALDMIFEAEKYSIRNKRHVKFMKEDGLFTDAIFGNKN